MPYFELRTNVSKDKIPPNFLKETAKVVATTLGKPLSYVVAHVVPDQMMSWGSDDANSPIGIVHLFSLGQLGVAPNKKHSQAISSHIEKNLGIPSDRLYIFFSDADKSNVGYSGTTFHDLL